MAKIVRLSDYSGLASQGGHAGTDGEERACDTVDAVDHSSLRLCMNDLLGRDYGRLEDVVHGILRIREILDRHIGPDPEWQGLLLDLLRESCRAVNGRRPGRGHQWRRPKAVPPRAVPRIQEYIEGRIGSGNVLELGSAVVILKLMEHTPRVRRLLR